MTTSRRNDQESGGTDPPGWILLVATLTLAALIVALPGIAVGWLVQRVPVRWLHWRLRFLLWFVLSAVSAFLLYQSYQHGLAKQISDVLADYVLAAEHHQANFLQWPLRSLWSSTWPLWLATLPTCGIAGLWFEVRTPAKSDTARTLRDQQRRRERQAYRSQRKARSRTRRPDRLPDETGGMMVIGVPIQDEVQEE